MSGFLYTAVREALRARLLSFQPFALTGTLGLTQPDRVTAASGLAAFLPGDEVELVGFPGGANGFAVVLSSSETELRVRRTISYTTQAPAPGRTVRLGLPENRLWEGFAGEIPSDRVTVRDRLAPQNSEPRSIGARRVVRHSGLYFVDVFYPYGFGPGAAERYAGHLLHSSLFPGLRLVASSGQAVVIRSSERAVAQYTANHVMIPCTIAWWSDTLTP